jgi:hypothetical protein
MQLVSEPAPSSEADIKARIEQRVRAWVAANDTFPKHIEPVILPPTGDSYVWWVKFHGADAIQGSWLKSAEDHQLRILSVIALSGGGLSVGVYA